MHQVILIPLLFFLIIYIDVIAVNAILSLIATAFKLSLIGIIVDRTCFK